MDSSLLNDKDRIYQLSDCYCELCTHTHIHTPGNLGEALSVDPNLYISRDAGVSWEMTIEGSWGVTVADHGGLMVAARDYHQNPSNEIKYSCNEGLSWLPFEFDNLFGDSIIVFGVITEPGEHTTVVR